MSRNNNQRFKKKANDPTRFMPKKVKQEMDQEKRIQKVETKVTKINRAIELKYFDSNIGAAAVVTGQLTLLNGTAQGLNQNNRIGAQIMMKSLQYRITFNSLATTVTPTIYRLMLVIDRQANGTALTVSGDPIVASTGALLNTAVIASPVVAPRQFETIKRFKILFDKTWSLNPNLTLNTNVATAASTVGIQKTISGFIKLGQIVKYDGQGSGIADINTNSLYAIAITDVANGVNHIGGFRLYYTDP